MDGISLLFCWMSLHIYAKWRKIHFYTCIITGSSRYPRPNNTQHRISHKMYLYCRSIMYVYWDMIEFQSCLSQPSALKLWLLLPSSPSLFCPESSSPLELSPMCSRSRHAACMPMGGSSQLRLLQVAEHLTLFKECHLHIITGSNQNALMIRSISRRAACVIRSLSPRDNILISRAGSKAQ